METKTNESGQATCWSSHKGSGVSMTKLNGWTHVGYYGRAHIYAKGDKRCLVDPETGEPTFEYRVTTSGTERSPNINGPVSAKAREGNKNAGL